MIASGIVLTGGTAIMEGIPEVAEDILELPVRRGKPINIGGLVDIVNSPLYATGVGLVLYGAKGEGAGGTLKFTDENLFGRVLSMMKEWVGELF